MKIPMLDLVRQYESIREEIDAAVLGVIRSGNYILGAEVEAFEKAAAEYCGVKHAIGVASGTDALLLSLRALDIGRGDSVILPSFTFFATAGVVHNVGATPVFCDIDPKTFNLDPEDVRRILTTHHTPRTTHHEPRTRIRAIIPVHLYGQMADMDEIMEIANEHDLAVIEDAAQAIGASYRRKLSKNAEPRTSNSERVSKAGSIGHLGCFSFYPTKNLGACGDGGMITTNDTVAYEKLRLLRVHGAKPKYYHRMIGTNSRLDAVQAAILRVKLRRLEDWNLGRRAVADSYDQELAAVPGITPPYRAPDRDHIFHQYTIRVADGRRDELREHLAEQGIGSMIYYPIPVHLQECFADLGYAEGAFPASEAACREVLSLPVFPEMSGAEREAVVQSIHGFFAAA